MTRALRIPDATGLQAFGQALILPFRDQARVQGNAHVQAFVQLKLHEITGIKLRPVEDALFPAAVKRQITMIFAPDNGFSIFLVAPKHNTVHFIPQYFVPEWMFPLPCKFDGKQSVRNIPDYVSCVIKIVAILAPGDANQHRI